MNFAYLMLALVAVACTPEPPPVAAVAKPVPPTIINRTIIRTQSDAPVGVPPRTAATVKEFRTQEKAARDARGYPGATRQELKDINDTEHQAHDATQKLINQDGHSTQQDQDQAHDAIDALRKAQQAPKQDKPP